MRALAHEDANGFEWLIDQLGYPRDRLRIEHLIDDWPDRLSHASPHILFALVRQAEPTVCVRQRHAHGNHR
jgi:hypothetical protein